jgi:hypothetical protein
MKQGRYRLKEQEKRERMAKMQEKKGYCTEAKDIREGDVFDKDGNPKSYWYVEATYPPKEMPTPRGQWVPVGYHGETPGWHWQEWK